LLLAAFPWAAASASPTIRIDDRRVIEANSGTATATFTVTLSAAAAGIVTVKGDVSLEVDERFSVTLANPTGGGGATIADALGEGTIQDDDMSSLICPGLAVTNGQVNAIVESD